MCRPTPITYTEACKHETLTHGSAPAVTPRGIHLAQALVLDPRHYPRRIVQGSEPPLGTVQVTFVHRAANGELIQRHAAGDEIAHRQVALLPPQVTGVEAVCLHGHERLGDEPFLHVERPQRGPPARRVTVERE